MFEFPASSENFPSSLGFFFLSDLYFLNLFALGADGDDFLDTRFEGLVAIDAGPKKDFLTAELDRLRSRFPDGEEFKGSVTKRATGFHPRRDDLIFRQDEIGGTLAAGDPHGYPESYL